MFDTTYTTQAFPQARNGVLDIVHEGRKRDIIYFTFEVDITDAYRSIKRLKAEKKQSPSITTYMIRCFAKTISEQKVFNAYRKGKCKLIVFDDVDVAITVEKEVNGLLIPVHYIVRTADKKKIGEIQAEIDIAKRATYEETVPELDRKFFGKTPGFLRSLFWAVARRRPKVQKAFSGTTGLTSVGMFGAGHVHLLPITFMTSTLAVGGLETKPKIIDGKIVERDILCLTLCVDHDIIDGAPAMRFITRFKNIAESCLELPRSSLLEETTPNIMFLGQKVECNVANH